MCVCVCMNELSSNGRERDMLRPQTHLKRALFSRNNNNNGIEHIDQWSGSARLNVCHQNRIAWYSNRAFAVRWERYAEAEVS